MLLPQLTDYGRKVLLEQIVDALGLTYSQTHDVDLLEKLDDQLERATRYDDLCR